MTLGHHGLQYALPSVKTVKIKYMTLIRPRLNEQLITNLNKRYTGSLKFLASVLLIMFVLLISRKIKEIEKEIKQLDDILTQRKV